MGNDYGGYSLSDIAAATGNGRNNGGFGDNSGWWIILLLLALGRGYGYGGGNGNGGTTFIPYGGFGGGFGGGFSNDYAWLSNGQKEIMQNTNQGFNTLQLSTQLNGIDNGVQNIATQLCTGFANTNQTISNGFNSAEIAANNRQMANMQQAFNSQVATMQGFNGLGSQLADCLKKISKKAKEILKFTKYKTVGSLVG